jgi:hypothetical protein
MLKRGVLHLRGAMPLLSRRLSGALCAHAWLLPCLAVSFSAFGGT